MKVVKPPPKNISMVDLCNAPTDDESPSDWISGKKVRREKRKKMKMRKEIKYVS